MVSGCGGGGDDTEDVQPTAPSKPLVMIEAYGDSTMWGFDPEINRRSDNTIPIVMETTMKSDYGLNVTVVNMGVGSSTVKTLVEGTDGVKLPWQQQLASSGARYVIMNFGLNDVLSSVGESPDEYREYLSKFVQYARQAGKIPVFSEPSPTCDPLRTRLPEYLLILRDVAATQNVPVIAQYDYLQALPNWSDYIKLDCVHPNSYVYSIMGKRAAAFMAQLLAQ